jgi:hypothetical protein
MKKKVLHNIFSGVDNNKNVTYRNLARKNVKNGLRKVGEFQP